MSENSHSLGRLGICTKEGGGRRAQGCVGRTTARPCSLSHLEAAGVVGLLSLELVLELLELLVAWPVLVLVSLELLLSPLEELALPSALAAFLLSPFVSLATALWLP